MFNPTRDQARLFFIDAWQKQLKSGILTPAETVAVHWINRHPEYHALLEDRDRALAADFSPDAGQTNPFLHLSMHLAVSEQLGIDQPPGIRAAYNSLCQNLDDEHEAMHHVFECLAEQIWQQQRNGLPFDNQRYLSCVRQVKQ
jgi:hypothetical protein